jgi:hypothetical protein
LATLDPAVADDDAVVAAVIEYAQHTAQISAE